MVDAAAVQQRDRAVGERGDLRVMGGEHDRDAVRAGRAGEGAQHLGAVGAVQRRGRLVGEEHRGRRRPARGRWRPAGAAPGAACAGRLRGAHADVEPLQPLHGGRLGGAGARRRAAAGAAPRSPRRSARVRAAGSASIQPNRSRRSRSRRPRAHGVHGDAVEPHLALVRAPVARRGSAAGSSCRCRAGR